MRLVIRLSGRRTSSSRKRCPVSKNSAFLATALMCRVATETALFTLVTRYETQVTQPDFDGDLPRERTVIAIDFSLLDENRWWVLWKRAEDMRLVDGNLKQLFDDLRENWGHVVAHYGPRLDRKLQENKLDWLLISEDQAKCILEQSVTILNSLMENYYRIKPRR